jgi:hypothetical protein
MYALWRLVKPGQGELLGSCSGKCDRISQVQFAAMSLGRYLVASDEELMQHLSDNPRLRVVTSVAFPTRSFHVLMRPEEYSTLNLEPDALMIENPTNVTFGGSVRLLGVDAEAWQVPRGGHLVVTRYWHIVGPPPHEELTINMAIDLGAGGQWEHTTRGCYDSCPFSLLTTGDVIVETYRLAVPPGLAPGSYPLSVGLRSATAGQKVAPDRLGAAHDFGSTLDRHSDQLALPLAGSA